MPTSPKTFKNVYTCKVSGQQYEYEVDYTGGQKGKWRARVYQDGDLKGHPEGQLVDNTLKGEALKQYISAYVEGLIERGLGIDE
jgi:hypothetical protein